MNTTPHMTDANLTAINTNRRTNGQFGSWHAGEAPTPDIAADPAPGTTIYQDRADAVSFEIVDHLEGPADGYDMDAVAGEVLEWHKHVISEPGMYLDASGYRRRAGMTADQIAAVAAKHRAGTGQAAQEELAQARAEAWEKTAWWGGYEDIDDFPAYRAFMDDDQADAYRYGVSAVLHTHNEAAADGYDIGIQAGAAAGYGPTEYALTVRIDTPAGAVRVLSEDEPLAATVAGARPDGPTDTFRLVHDEMLAQRTRFVAKVKALNAAT